MVTPGRFRAYTAVVLVLTLVSCATAKYSGGSGTARDPYQIATAADLIALGETPSDYDKHFLLTADIDLDPNLPGRKVFDKAVIAAGANNMIGWFDGSSFTGVFDGNRHKISHLTIKGEEHLGLFGSLGVGGEIKDLGIVDVDITGSDSVVGALVGSNGITWWDVGGGMITRCYSTGSVSGKYRVGGLVGSNGSWDTSGCIVMQCYSTAEVSGNGRVGGLVGYNRDGDVTQCYSTGAVSGEDGVGGLVGENDDGGTVTAGFWDTQTSGQSKSAGGTGKTTAEMQSKQTYLDAGWDFVGEIQNGTHETWQMSPEGGYPVIAILSGYAPAQLQGSGTAEDPYLISNAQELGAMIYYSSRAHYRLAAHIDLAGIRWSMAILPRLAGTFDGNDMTISHLTIKGEGENGVGLFGRLESAAEVKNLGVVDVNITGSGWEVGGLVGHNEGGTLAQCYSTGAVSGNGSVGGLVGFNGNGYVTQCYSTATVSGSDYVGGLTGNNWGGDITQCHITSTVSGNSRVGGLVGENYGTIMTSCSAGEVRGGDLYVGGLVGFNMGTAVYDMGIGGIVTDSYSISMVSGDSSVGGLAGGNSGYLGHCYSAGLVRGAACGGLLGWNMAGYGLVTDCFWDVQTSGQTTSAGGTGKTTAEMQTASTFLKAGWDFMGETANGTEDIWWILEGKDYPRLWWEIGDAASP
jgi:hypothetical protein